MDKKSRWARGVVGTSLLSIALGASAVCLLSGCRSADVASFGALAESQPTPPDSLAKSDTPSQPPSYAQGDASGSTNNNANIQLASAKVGGHAARGSASANLVTLRTLSANDDFKAIVDNAPGVVLVDFYADWCGPCRKQGKVLHGLESFAAANQAQIIKVDVDQHKAIAKQFNVASLPTLVVIKNGEMVDRKVGLTDESRLRSMMR